jgi:hypothetical protein
MLRVHTSVPGPLGHISESRNMDGLSTLLLQRVFLEASDNAIILLQSWQWLALQRR